MTTHWKAILGVILIFIFGFAAGVVSSSIYVHHKLVEILQHPAVALSAALEKRVTRNLHLDADQKQKIHQIFLDNLQERRELQKQIQPQIRMATQESFQEIIAVLRPDQQEVFHQNVAEMKARFAQIAGNNENAPPTMGQAPSPATNPGTAAPPVQ